MDQQTAIYVSIGLIVFGILYFIYLYLLKKSSVKVEASIFRVKQKSRKGRYYYIPYVDIMDGDTIIRNKGIYGAKSYNEYQYVIGDSFPLYKGQFLGTTKYFSLRSYYSNPIISIVAGVIGFVYVFFA